jgi:glycosyltransferase involved in cell wall biosynthesis
VIEQKNILFLSPFFYPEPISTGKFNSDIALALSKKGHQVTVLCFHPFYPDWKVKKSNEKLHQIKIIRGGVNMFFTKKTLIRRLLLEISYSWFVLKNIKKYQKNIDILIAVFPPSLYLFSIIPFLSKKLKIVGMVHDLQQLYASTKKGFLNRFVTFFINKVEKNCFNACDKLVFLSEEMKNEAEKMYGLNPNKCSVQYPFHSLYGIFTDNLSTSLKQ